MQKKLVVITGASSGIGEACAKLFSSQGYPLLLIARRLDRMNALNLPNTICRQVDIKDRKAFEAALDEAQKLYGYADCLINNAGRMLLSELETQDPEEWQDMFDLNVISILNSMQVVIPNMKKHKSGTIINVGSVAGKKHSRNRAAYSGTKFALGALTESARMEHSADGIRITLINPGVVETELLSHTTSQTIKENYQKWKESMGYGLKSEDVAKSILFIYQQPQEVCIRELTLSKTSQEI